MKKPVLSPFSLFASSAALVVALAMTSATVKAAPFPSDVQGGTYKVDPNHTQVIFSLLHFGFTNYSGMFSAADGMLTFDPANPGATHLQVSLKTESVQTTSDRLTGELKGPDWLDAATYPTARFVSTRITPAASGEADVDGMLTLHGMTHPVVLHARFIGAGANPMDKAYTIGFDGTAEIQRSAFGISKYVPMVGDTVTLHIAGAFEKKN